MSCKETNATWLIGAGSFCDLMIDHPGVSSRHCQLTSIGLRLMLDDQGSTNGTWVNGTRITAPVEVGPNDTIQLGTQTRVTWQQIESLLHSRVLRIGREADNDVVLSHETVSGYHARLLMEGDQLTLIDLDSGNGTAVGAPDRKVSRAHVSAGDDVYFASTRCRVSDLVAAVPARGKPFVRSGNNRPGIIAAALSVTLLTALCVFLLRSPGPVELDRAVIDTVAISTAVDASAADSSQEERMQRSLFAVVVRSAASEPGLRVGTAWAISEQELATSGNVVLFLQQSGSEFPIVTVQRILDGQEHAVTTSVVHPVCQERADRMQELGAKIEKARSDLDTFMDSTNSAAPQSSDERMSPENVRRLADQILTLEDQWFVAAEDMIHFDVGLLETNESVTGGVPDVPLRFATETASRLASVAVAGAAFAHDQSVVLETSELPVLSLECTLESKLAHEGDGVSRLVLKCSPEHIHQNWLGAPALDSSGRVMGLYSRPTPSPDPDTPPDGSRCDIVSVARIADLWSPSE